MQSITTDFEKNIQENMACFPTHIEENCNILDDNLLINDAEFKKFSSECDDYSNFENLDEFYEGLPVVEDLYCHVPIVEKIIPKEDVWVLVGVTNKKLNKKERRMIVELCNVSPVTNTHKKKCKKYHTFNALPLCVDCKLVTYHNNYYSGKCTKRHKFESIGNYLIRNEIKKDVEKINLTFFEKPTISFLKGLLFTVNKYGYKELTIEIEKCSRMTLDEFFEKN